MTIWYFCIFVPGTKRRNGRSTAHALCVLDRTDKSGVHKERVRNDKL